MTADLVRVVGARVVDPDAVLTAEQIRDLFARIGKLDPEAAHSVEDDMLRAALEAIRDGHVDPAALARDVLIVADADFPRWMS